MNGIISGTYWETYTVVPLLMATLNKRHLSSEALWRDGALRAFNIMELAAKNYFYLFRALYSLHIVLLIIRENCI